MTNRTTNSAAPVALFRRFGAALGVALLLLLSASAASPALHHWLHADDEADTSDNCAVVLFASGVTLAAAAAALAGPTVVWQQVDRQAFEELFVVSPRYLRQPERGPPAC